jgi:hypothetical protein
MQIYALAFSKINVSYLKSNLTIVKFKSYIHFEIKMICVKDSLRPPTFRRLPSLSLSLSLCLPPSKFRSSMFIIFYVRQESARRPRSECSYASSRVTRCFQQMSLPTNHSSPVAQIQEKVGVWHPLRLFSECFRRRRHRHPSLQYRQQE